MDREQSEPETQATYPVNTYPVNTYPVNTYPVNTSESNDNEAMITGMGAMQKQERCRPRE